VATFDRHGIRQRLPLWRWALRAGMAVGVFGFELHNWVNTPEYRYASLCWEITVVLFCSEYVILGAQLWLRWLDRRWLSRHRYAWGIHQDVNNTWVDDAVVRRVNRRRRRARREYVRQAREESVTQPALG